MTEKPRMQGRTESSVSKPEGRSKKGRIESEAIGSVPVWHRQNVSLPLAAAFAGTAPHFAEGWLISWAGWCSNVARAACGHIIAPAYGAKNGWRWGMTQRATFFPFRGEAPVPKPKVWPQVWFESSRNEAKQVCVKLGDLLGSHSMSFRLLSQRKAADNTQWCCFKLNAVMS